MNKKYKFGTIFLAAMTFASILSGCQSPDKTPQQASQATDGGIKSEGTAAESAADNAQAGETDKAAAGNGNILIAYFAVAENSDVDAASSASMVMIDGEAKGRIGYLAELIQQETGGRMFSIETSVAYPGDGEKLVDYAAEEQDRDERPEITNHIENLEQYDTVFVGFPTWWYDLPQVMYSFFDEYDFSGKTIIPFNSHNGSRFSGTISTIQDLEPGAEVVTDGFTISERSITQAGDEVASWLEGLGF